MSPVYLVGKLVQLHLYPVELMEVPTFIQVPPLHGSAVLLHGAV